MAEARKRSPGAERDAKLVEATWDLIEKSRELLASTEHLVRRDKSEDERRRSRSSRS